MEHASEEAAVTRKDLVEDFLSQRVLALAGASRTGKKFGNAILKELEAKGYEVLLVHPETAEINGKTCFPSLAALPKPVGGLLLVVPPAKAEQLVREAADLGIPRIWMQQGSSSPGAIRLCETKGIAAVHGECILMFARPTTGVHRFHHWLWGVFGKLPVQSDPPHAQGKALS
jgi:hypothetical protein